MASLIPNQVIDAEVQLVGEQQGIPRKLEVIEQLGEGGMARVYEVRPVGNSVGIKRESIALKLLRMELFADDGAEYIRFLREMKITTKLLHSNIARPIGTGTIVEDGNPFFLSEFIPGVAVGTYLNGVVTANGLFIQYRNADNEERTRTLCLGELQQKLPQSVTPMNYVYEIMQGVLKGIGYAHENGIVHRDLKPDNVMVVFQGNLITSVKILDFGISKALKASSDTQHTKTGTVLGTPEYMSPEQMLGSKELDHRTDIYSAGLLLLALLTGLRFMNIETENNVGFFFRRLSNEASYDLADYVIVPELIRQIVLKATAYHAKDRYQSAFEMLQAWEEAIKSIRALDSAFAKTELGPVASQRVSRVSPIPSRASPVSVRSVPSEHRTRTSLTEVFAGTVKKAKRFTYLSVLIGFLVFLFGGGMYFAARLKDGSITADSIKDSAIEKVRSITTAIKPEETENATTDSARISSVIDTPTLSAQSVSLKMNEAQKARYSVGVTLLRGRDVNRALGIFLDLEKSGVRDPDLLSSISRAYARKGDTRKAGEYRKKASEPSSSTK